MRDEALKNPELTDFHGRKRELLRRGVEQGQLTWTEIQEHLPQQFMGETELEVFLFTCKNMGIKLIGLPEGNLFNV